MIKLKQFKMTNENWLKLNKINSNFVQTLDLPPNKTFKNHIISLSLDLFTERFKSADKSQDHRNVVLKFPIRKRGFKI